MHDQGYEEERDTQEVYRQIFDGSEGSDDESGQSDMSNLEEDYIEQLLCFNFYETKKSYDALTKTQKN